MFKMFTITVSAAAVLVGAMTLAGAGNSTKSDLPVAVRTAHNLTTGTVGVDCSNQVWPNIDQKCLVPVSDAGKVRQARVIF